MTSEELRELMTKGRHDGAQLFSVANAIYKVSIVLNFIVGAVGIITFLVAMIKNEIGAAFVVAIFTPVICAIGYALAVLGSNGAKVLVHLLFSNLAILEKQQEVNK